jgi:hypothetical protein
MDAQQAAELDARRKAVATALMRDAGKAVVEGDALVIRVPLEVLPTVVEGAWASGGMDTRLLVTSPAKLAAELCLVLNDEDERGTTRVHKMFDSALWEAYEQGYEGIDVHPNQDA